MSRTYHHLPLPQGPMPKNRALLDVEAIVSGLLDSSKQKDTELFLNHLGHIIVRFPNDSHSYNASLAVRNARLHYLFLEESQLIAYAQEIEEGLEEDGSLRKSEKLTSGIGLNDDNTVIYEIEESHLIHYTDEGHKKNYSLQNIFLRGASLITANLTPSELRSLILTSLITVSAVNKLVEPDLTNADQLVYRWDDANFLKHTDPKGVPDDCLIRLLTDGIMPIQSLFSTSKNPNLAIATKRELCIRLPKGSQSSIACISTEPNEEEVLYMPGIGLRVLESEQLSLRAEFFWGPQTESFDTYDLDLGLAHVSNVLKVPYTEDHTNHSEILGIERPNHALAHHIRQVFYIDPIINYFSKYAADISIKQFCENISLEQRNDIKLLIAFYAVGRESELSFKEDLPANSRYREISAEKLACFLKNQLFWKNEEKIALYKELLRWVVDPEYIINLEQFKDDHTQQKKSIYWIVTLAHNFDLPRCYSKEDYDNELLPFSGEHDSIAGFVISSNNQKKSFNHLKKLVFYSLQQTGDRINFSNADVFSQHYNEESFVLANTFPDYCRSRLEIAKALSIDKNISSKLETIKIENIINNMHRFIEAIAVEFNTDEEREYYIKKIGLDKHFSLIRREQDRVPFLYLFKDNKKIQETYLNQLAPEENSLTRLLVDLINNSLSEEPLTFAYREKLEESIKSALKKYDLTKIIVTRHDLEIAYETTHLSIYRHLKVTNNSTSICSIAKHITNQHPNIEYFFPTAETLLDFPCLDSEIVTRCDVTHLFQRPDQFIGDNADIIIEYHKNLEQVFSTINDIRIFFDNPKNSTYLMKTTRCTLIKRLNNFPNLFQTPADFNQLTYDYPDLIDPIITTHEHIDTLFYEDDDKLKNMILEFQKNPFKIEFICHVILKLSANGLAQHIISKMSINEYVNLKHNVLNYLALHPITLNYLVNTLDKFYKIINLSDHYKCRGFSTQEKVLSVIRKLSPAAIERLFNTPEALHELTKKSAIVANLIINCHPCHFRQLSPWLSISHPKAPRLFSAKDDIRLTQFDKTACINLPYPK